jgi:predicted methyltransferase
MPERTCTESFKVAADQLVDAVRKILHEGNVRRVVIKQAGQTVVEFPMTVGVVGAVFAPVLAAAGALAAVLTDCTIEVERVVRTDGPSQRDAARSA